MCKPARHDPYSGRRGHVKRLVGLFEHPECAWQYWLSRRSHKGHRHGQKYAQTLRPHRPLPEPRIIHSIAQRQGQQRDAPNGKSPVG